MSAAPVGESRADDRPWRRGPLVRAVRDRAASLKPQIVPRSMRGFPYTKPTVPHGVELRPEEETLGLAYDTDWAREPGARVARRALQNALLVPGLKAMTAPTVHGLDRIKHLDGPVIFAPNHHSHLDTGLVLSVLPTKFREKTIIAGAADYFFDKRPKAFLSALMINAVPIERKRTNRRSIDAIRALLTDGWSLIIFPEGGRSPDGLGQEFKAGATFLAQRQGCPVVPVHIAGTDIVLPKGASMPKRHACTITFGHPIIPSEGDDARDLAMQLEHAVDALADEQQHDWWTARRNAATASSPSLRGDTTASSWRRQWQRTSNEKPNQPKGTKKRNWP